MCREEPGAALLHQINPFSDLSEADFAGFHDGSQRDSTP
jgi:hypothetical protein